ncbi:hypothetical protein PMI35_00530, partial [Pseudomonas sp. GM78]
MRVWPVGKPLRAAEPVWLVQRTDSGRPEDGHDQKQQENTTMIYAHPGTEGAIV